MNCPAFIIVPVVKLQFKAVLAPSENQPCNINLRQMTSLEAHRSQTTPAVAVDIIVERRDCFVSLGQASHRTTKLLAAQVATFQHAIAFREVLIFCLLPNQSVRFHIHYHG